MNSRRPRSLSDYSGVARRRGLILIVPGLVLAIATAIALSDQPNLYEATARMWLTSVKADSAPDSSAYLDRFREYLTSREALSTLISTNTPDAEYSESVISRVRERIAMEADTGRDAQRGAFTLSYRSTDPETARSTTDEMVNRLVTLSSKEPSSPVSEVEFVRVRAAGIAIQLRELEQKDPWLTGVRSGLSGATPAPSSRSSQPSPVAVRAQQMTIDLLKDQQYKIHKQIADVDGRITAQRQIVEQQKKGSTLRDNPTYAVLIAKRAELQGQRDTLINRQELTDKHPRVLAINDQISAINRQIEELRQQDITFVGQSPEARELAALESERNRLNIDLEVTGRELARRSADGLVQAATTEPSPVRRSAGASKLAEQYLGLKRSHQEATSELQDAEARLRRADGDGLAPLRVLQPATLPARPVLPNRPILISIAAAVGMLFGTLFAVFAESRRFKSLLDARDVEFYTRLPLLAAIPRTATTSERRRARWRAAARLAFATATSVVATLALTKLFIAADVFALIIKK